MRDIASPYVAGQVITRYRSDNVMCSIFLAIGTVVAGFDFSPVSRFNILNIW